MPTPNINPLIDAYEAIWSMLRGCTDFTTLFPTDTPHQQVENTDLTYYPEQDLEELAPADYPRCRVSMRRCKPATERDSSTSYLDVTYAIEVCTGSQQQTIAMKSAWAIYRAMLNWRDKARDVITWHGYPCVMDVDAEEIDFADEKGEWGQQTIAKSRSRGTNQWISMWQTTVKLYFPTDELLAAQWATTVGT